MRSSTYDIAIFLIGTSNNLYEASVSSILRIVETFQPKTVYVIYSAFAKKIVDQVLEFVKQFYREEYFVDPYKLPKIADLPKEVERMLLSFKGCSVLLVPTAGSVTSIIYFVHYATLHNIDIAHVVFPYRYWTGLYYPFVPRYLQNIILISNHNVNLSDIELTNILERNFNELKICKNFPELYKEIGRISYEINRKWRNPAVGLIEPPDLCINIQVESDKSLRISLVLDNVIIDSFSIDVPNIKKYVNELKNILHGVSSSSIAKKYRIVIKWPESIRTSNSIDIRLCTSDQDLEQSLITFLAMFLLGLHVLREGEHSEDPKQSVKKLLRDLHQVRYMLGLYNINIEEDTNIVIDTNMIYRGIHNYASQLKNRLYVPYCAEVEILLRISESKDLVSKFLGHFLYYALDVLKFYSNYLPTLPERCDFSIPKVDPDMIKGFTVMTGDRSAYELWSGLAFSKYVNLKYVSENDLQKVSGDDIGVLSRIHFAIIQLYALLKTFYEKYSR